MTRSARALAALLLAVVPALALAAGPQALSLKSGVPAELLAKTLAIARGLFALSLVLGLLVEAFSDSPDRSKSYGGVAWRALVVVALLAGYPRLFGTVIVTAEALAERIAPREVWERFAEQMEQSSRALAERAQQHVAEQGQPSAVDVLTSSSFVATFIGGQLLDSLVVMLVMLAQAFQWAFGQLTRILLALFYVLGPLALVFHIPGPVRTAGKWFNAFVTIACWPILSAVLLAIATSLMFRTDTTSMSGEYATAFGAVASALLMVLLNLAVPLLASAIVGGGVRNIAGTSLAGAAMFAGWAGALLRGASAGAASASGAATGASAGSASGGAGSGGGGVASAGVVAPGPAPASAPSGGTASGGSGGHAQAGGGADPIAVALGVTSTGAAPPRAPPASYQAAAASVPLMSEPSLSYQPPQARTGPGHPYDELKDNGWGDVGQLAHVGWVRPPAAPLEDPHERITAPPDNGLIQLERIQKKARTKN